MAYLQIQSLKLMVLESDIVIHYIGFSKVSISLTQMFVF